MLTNPKHPDTYQDLKAESLNDLTYSGLRRAAQVKPSAKLLRRSGKRTMSLPSMTGFRYRTFTSSIEVVTLPTKYCLMDRYMSCWQHDYTHESQRSEYTYKNVTRIRARRTR